MIRVEKLVIVDSGEEALDVTVVMVDNVDHDDVCVEEVEVDSIGGTAESGAINSSIP